MAQLKRILTRVKPYLRWVIVGLTLFFVVATLRQHWQEVTAIAVTPTGWACLTIALGVIMAAQIWSGLVWGWILAELHHNISSRWTVPVYLKTNLAKYIPGNVWHFYGRVAAVHKANVPLSVATLGVLLEPILMATAALMIGTLGYFQALGLWNLGLIFILAGLHPRVINIGLKILEKLSFSGLKQLPHAESTAKAPNPEVNAKVVSTSPTVSPPTSRTSSEQVDAPPICIRRYPWKPLLGELGYVLLRGLGFTLVLVALMPIAWSAVPAVIGAFSLAWLVGFIVPGAPGGIGVFEAVALWLLSPTYGAALILAVVALHRLTSVLSEVLGAALVVIDERLTVPAP